MPTAGNGAECIEQTGTIEQIVFQFIERCGYAEPYDDNNRRGNYILQFTAHDLGYNDQGGFTS